jgi:hypothetical protein
METIVSRLDQALNALQAQGLTPVTIVLSEGDHAALAEVPDWPVTTTTRGELRFRGSPVFKGAPSEPSSLVGRGMNGATRRLPFPAA